MSPSNTASAAAEVLRRLAQQGGYAAFTVGELRDLHGHRRARERVTEKIAATLAEADVAHLPVLIPQEQDRQVIAWTREAALRVPMLATFHHHVRRTLDQTPLPHLDATAETVNALHCLTAPSFRATGATQQDRKEPTL
ncbi:hypothetical protein [Kitasatospora sp. NPDC098663]|uniref:hypothetical protein n=1 Tax=Kitasatospora sp. NPDC098663 TaxID=3364096 RepID=UPI0037F8216A